MANALRAGCVGILLFTAAGYSRAQKLPVSRTAPQSTPAQPPPAGMAPTAPTNLRVTFISETEIDLAWAASTAASGETITGYQVSRCVGTACVPPPPSATTSTTSITFADTSLTPETTYTYQVTAVDSATPNGNLSSPSSVTARTTKFTCYLFSVRRGCMQFPLDKSTSDAAKRQNNINAFYQTNGSLSFFNQIKSIYNGASGAATVSADLATMNFSDGTQITVGTNVQAGSSGATTVSSGTVPTLSANGAGQATQNMLYGGTFFVSEMYPVAAAWGSSLGAPGGFGLLVDLIAREGADIQNFKSGTNVNVSSPPFHGSGQMEGYLQYNSINVLPGTQNFVGAVFVGGSYGYSYMSHDYARDYGFRQVSNGIGQVSFGVLISGVARIAVSRAFGPSQTYIDSTTMAQTTVNNFKAWSFGITYQSPPPTAPASKE